MYADEKEFVKDFSFRTKENYKAMKDGPYEVTQLINSMIGLLIIPETNLFNKITDSLLSDDLLSQMKACITNNTYLQPIDLKQICRHLRNAVAHSNLKFKAEKAVHKSDSLMIKEVIFTDGNIRQKEYFEMRISIDLLEEFLFKFSEAITSL